MNNQNFYKLILWSVFGILLFLFFSYAVNFIDNLFKILLSFIGAGHTASIVQGVLIRLAEIAFILIFGLKFINPSKNRDNIEIPKVFFILLLALTPVLYFINVGLSYYTTSMYGQFYSMYDYGSYFQYNAIIMNLFYFFKYSAIAIVAIILLVKYRNNN